MASPGKRLGVQAIDWLDERAGVRAVARAMLEEPVPGGARWAYVWGSCLAFVLLLQAVTGVLLASFYSPSVTDAWASVAYIQDELTLGWFIRGMHSSGAGAMVVLLCLHLLQVTLFGAYKRPRELNWIIGVVLLGLTLGFALTGYLLPWDQKGYWATQVATSLMGATPLVGPALQRLIQGGDSYGNLTPTHFYALHVLVMPATVIGFTVLHVWLFRKHGVTPSWRQGAEELERRRAPFWPDQLLRDAVAMALVFGAMVYLVVRDHGVPLDAPADPTSAYDARPEFYFLPLFQLLKLFPGRAEVWAALGVPAIVVGGLLALPFLDRGESRDPRRRISYIAGVCALVLGALGLGVQATRQDAGNEDFQRQRQAADREGERARMLARQGIPPAGGTAMYENDPEHRARQLYALRCAGCHVLAGKGENEAPTLDGWMTRAWIAGVLRDPDAPAYYGKTKVRGMKPVQGSEEELHALVEYVYAVSGQEGASGVDAALRAKGEALFSEKDCDGCHEIDGESENQAPNLGARATLASLRAFLADPSAGRFFGKKNHMPRFGQKLTAAEIEALGALVLAERGR